MVVYRGTNYKRPSRSQLGAETSPTEGSLEGDTFIVPDVSGLASQASGNDSRASGNDSRASSLTLDKAKPLHTNIQNTENMSEEEAEFNHLLDGLGPRFIDWWGTGVLPVDADLLPQTISGFKTPLRLVPTGMRSRLTNAEMTDLRKLARKLPSHFALGMLLLKHMVANYYVFLLFVLLFHLSFSFPLVSFLSFFKKTFCEHREK